ASAIWLAPYGVLVVTLDIADLPSPALDKLSRQQFFEEEEFDRVCTFIQGESSEVAKGWPDNYFSMIFVDGEHTYEDGKADILAWSPKLKSGGWMLFHDYSDSQFTLVRSIDELVRDSGEFTDFRVAKNLGFGISSMAGAVKK
ncbi:MAG: class I SAM-dependent methyltransferase, partial [Candidatus Curtissbacteria bacterium]|nr:class I SAM-dependent methyltransferase [Candidatus Curtissbacteria bacterium]